MELLASGRYRARLADGASDLVRAQALRHRCFLEETGAQAGETGRDCDAFDAICTHVLIEETATARLVACFRLLDLKDGSEIARSYSAQYYNLEALEAYPGRMAEVGRFCIAPEVADADVLRLAWAALTAYVDGHGVEMLFGCSSFKGTEAQGYSDAFALLRDRHLAPSRWLPKVKAPRVFQFAKRLRLAKPDARRAAKGMPPLLKTYLLMGGWVSDHAVVDAEMNTLHVFTGLEIGAIPPARAERLRHLAG